MDPFKGRVLILDDEHAVGRSIELMANHLGFEPKSVTDASDFFEAIRTWNPTHIILDLVMPGMDGVEVLQRLGAEGCEANIGITSGIGKRVLHAAKRSAAEHGLHAIEILPKPFSVAALSAFLSVDQQEPTEKRRRAQLTPEIYEPVTMSDIQVAIEQRQIQLVFQPKIDCMTRMVRGFEALARWHHPVRGIIMPDRFIPLSERIGLIGAITNQVIELSLDWYSGLESNTHLSISINISAKTLGSSDFPDELEMSCKSRSIKPSQVILEVTETAATDDQLLALDMFTRLRMKGFHISIDDFGVGNSTLAMLARLPFSEIKVDKSFAMTAGSFNESRAIIQSTVDLSHSLDLHVVTEGVEDAETLNFLEEIGCDFAQGYHIARPMPGDKVIEWMARRTEDYRLNLL